MNSIYVWSLIFFCIGYLILTDPSIAKLFYLGINFIGIQFLRIQWIILHHPANPIVKYLIWRRSWKLAKELQQELAEKQKTL